DIGRQFKRQHGHGAVRKVNTGAAQPRFLVECGVGGDVLCYVGDMHLQLEIAVGEIAHGDGVVKVARSLAVDGDDGQSAEIAAVAKFLRRDDGAYILRLFKRCRGKVMRQVKLADGDFDVDTEVVLAAEDF